KIAAENIELGKLSDRLADYQAAKDRIPPLLQDRESGYAQVFDFILAEEQVLRDLYAPIRQRLEAEKGTLGKLSFSVR
ncbi:hypothetical protein LXJ59_29305, partial [Escherichia coli]|nr:hypothetical protein [Escherichia coli]